MSKQEYINTSSVAKIINRSVGHTRDRVIHSERFTPSKLWDGKEYVFNKEEVERWYFEQLETTKPSRRNPAKEG